MEVIYNVHIKISIDIIRLMVFFPSGVVPDLHCSFSCLCVLPLMPKFKMSL